LISVAVGLALAVAYHFLSLWLQRWASKKRAMMAPIVSVLGFFVRLTVFACILVVFGLWSPLNILALCLAFVVVFTTLNGIWLYTLATKRRGVPPSPGATGAR
jgi:hypothetical protein